MVKSKLKSGLGPRRLARLLPRSRKRPIRTSTHVSGKVLLFSALSLARVPILVLEARARKRSSCEEALKFNRVIVHDLLMTEHLFMSILGKIVGMPQSWPPRQSLARALTCNVCHKRTRLPSTRWYGNNCHLSSLSQLVDLDRRDKCAYRTRRYVCNVREKPRRNRQDWLRRWLSKRCLR